MAVKFWNILSCSCQNLPCACAAIEATAAWRAYWWMFSGYCLKTSLTSFGNAFSTWSRTACSSWQNGH